MQVWRSEDNLRGHITCPLSVVWDRITCSLQVRLADLLASGSSVPASHFAIEVLDRCVLPYLTLGGSSCFWVEHFTLWVHPMSYVSPLLLSVPKQGCLWRWYAKGPAELEFPIRKHEGVGGSSMTWSQFNCGKSGYLDSTVVSALFIPKLLPDAPSKIEILV